MDKQNQSDLGWECHGFGQKCVKERRQWKTLMEGYQGSHLRKKTAFFTQKKSRLRKSENAVRLLYAKNSDLTHQNAFSLFVFCT